MRRIVDMTVMLFMLALVVAPYPSLSRMATPQDCVVECDAYCKERWKGDTRNLRLCYVNCKKLRGASVTDVIYGCILDCAESMSTSFVSGVNEAKDQIDTCYSFCKKKNY
nr:uncharacterized protein LOC112010412 [Quercus suber]POE53101.1 hypothetical protein CFP56_13645 [Quercus suber]